MKFKRPVISSRRKRKLHWLVSQWYEHHRRELPWRRTKDPYRVLVSEIMLQQTRVNHVAGKYWKFLKRFPTIRRLASAPTGKVIRAWSGLGYNVRAPRLHRLAKEVVEIYEGRIPDRPEALMQLPGIGRYTAHAVLSFAYHQSVPVVDTNIRRVFSRIFFRTRLSDQQIPDSLAWEIAEAILPMKRSRDWTLALMDLGSTICTGRKPECERCPLGSVCKSAYLLNGERSPKQRKKIEPTHDGIPHRIYRGRVVEVLRNLNGREWLDLRVLGKRIKTSFKPREELWLKNLLGKLEKDGLIRMSSRRSGVQVSLP
jgi:A/G-specific adenine glycosylase